MLTLAVDSNQPQPLYQQISDQLLSLIASGLLPLGEKLPTVRQLAADLNINMNTVAAAYKYLEQLGLVEVRHGAGAQVVNTLPNPAVFNREAARNIKMGVALLQLSGIKDDPLLAEIERIMKTTADT